MALENTAKTDKKSKKIVKIDEKDKKIFNLLSQNSRTTLKEIARQVGMSIDGVKGRMDKMLESGAIMRLCAIPDPQQFGLPIDSQVYVKLKNITDDSFKRFLAYLKNHDRIIIVFSVIGDYDLFFVILSKSATELASLKNEIRGKFPDVIADWKETVTAEYYKYEVYKF